MQQCDETLCNLPSLRRRSWTIWTPPCSHLLADEPRIGVLEASRRLGVARGTVQARLDKLAAGRRDLPGWGPSSSPEALGYPVTAFLTLEIRQGAGHESVGAAPGPDPGGARGGHDHRRRRHVGAGGGPLQHRPPAGHRRGARRTPAIVRSSTVIALATQIPYRVLPLMDASRRTASAARVVSPA